VTGAPAGPRAVLVGPMGAGKTTVGRLLADRWGVGFRDTDEDIEAAEGRPVSEIFVDLGEEYFRHQERRAVASALVEHDGVLALGGGAVLDPATRTALTGRPVVFLRVGLADAVKRVGLGAGRPLLLGNVRSRVKALLDERLPVYLAVAEVVVDTDGRSAEEVAAAVADALAEPDARPGPAGEQVP
jgi:shikimate kinase